MICLEKKVVIATNEVLLTILIRHTKEENLKVNTNAVHVQGIAPNPVIIKKNDQPQGQDLKEEVILAVFQKNDMKQNLGNDLHRGLSQSIRKELQGNALVRYLVPVVNQNTVKVAKIIEKDLILPAVAVPLI